jgi:uncharacterized protein
MASNVRILTEAQCLTRLSDQRIGRVSITKDALPVIVPVSYVADGTSIVFRTNREGMLLSACDGNVIAFEADDFSANSDGGWSVLIIGVAHRLTVSEHVRALSLGLVTAAGEDCDEFIRLRVGRISGREIAAGSLAALAG